MTKVTIPDKPAAKDEPVISPLTNDEFFATSRRLEQHHAVFYKLWEMGKPVFDPNVPTAQVEFDQDGQNVAFVFNPDFYASLTDYERDFIIAHECMHVILNHGVRIKDCRLPQASNHALDIVVNHLLVEKFGFDRSKLSMQDKICWIDTVFEGKALVYKDEQPTLVDQKDNIPGAQPVPAGKSFEFYYDLLYREITKNPAFAKLLSALDELDAHGGLGGDAGEIVKKLNDSLSPEEKETLRNVVVDNYQEGSGGGIGEGDGRSASGTGSWTFVHVGQVVKKRKWETVIKQWSRKYWKPSLKDVEQWARINRRFTMLPTDLMIPSEMEMDHMEEEKHKIDVWFFQDTSGSCWHLKERFFKAAASLPPERFNVRLFCFDTQVQETTLESKKIYGGGGTSFRIIESFIQRSIKGDGSKYPEAVFVITDGAGDHVSPQFPKAWYIFLTGSDRCFPKTCNIHRLRDYE